MKKIRIGVLCPSEIAFRRFLPALKNNENYEFVGVSVASAEEWFGEPTEELISLEREKAQRVIDSYEGKIFNSYDEMLSSDEIDAIYIPLPPALHYMWGKKALENRKHVLLEKPFTTSVADTEELIMLADQNGLAVHENYMFVYHSQIEWICERISKGDIGEVRLIRVDFGFPFRGTGDFRYNKELGGGALLDCGGYTVKLAEVFLGETARIVTSRLNYKENFDVDIYGSATIVNDDGLIAQVSFGMDNSYKCSVEVWGSQGTIYTNRILTAPTGFEPVVVIKQGNDEQSFTLPADDTFGKSIEHFRKCIINENERRDQYARIRRQGVLVEDIRKEG